jgi:hypothetical protein
MDFHMCPVFFQWLSPFFSPPKDWSTPSKDAGQALSMHFLLRKPLHRNGCTRSSSFFFARDLSEAVI